jgi:hypothetical protein
MQPEIDLQYVNNKSYWTYRGVGQRYPRTVLVISPTKYVALNLSLKTGISPALAAELQAHHKSF